MWHRGTVFVVQSDEIAGNHFAKDLRELRWRVHCFASVNALLERLSGQVTDAIVLRDRYDDPSLSIAAARAAPGAALAWQDADACAQARIAAMDAGADACPAPDMSMAEWDALLRTLCRRLQGAGRPAPAWRVDMHARVLAGPAGERLPLTATERAFLVRLLNAPDHCLRRERFLPRNAAVERDSVRRVDVLVSRLRSRRGGSISTCRYWRCGGGATSCWRGEGRRARTLQDDQIVPMHELGFGHAAQDAGNLR